MTCSRPAHNLCSRGFRHYFAAILGAFGLLQASVGIYGTVSYAVVQRTREMGIRMALGAEKRHVVRLILRDSIRPVLWGLLIVLVAAVGAMRLIQAILFGVSSFDPISFLSVSVVLLGIALLRPDPGGPRGRSAL